MPEVTENEFHKLLHGKLEDNYQRALEIFKKYGKVSPVDVTTVLLHSADKDKVDEVLSILEKHWSEQIEHQHPDTRGVVVTKATGIMFIGICQDTLGLQQTQSSERSRKT